MNLKIEISSKEDAKVALVMLSAYIGGEAIAETVKNEKQPVQEQKVADVKKPVKQETKKEVKEDPIEDDELGDDPVEEKPSKSKITLEDLTAVAKEAVSRTDKSTVKDTIGEFADRLSSVEEKDYAALAKKLKAL